MHAVLHVVRACVLLTDRPTDLPAVRSFLSSSDIERDLPSLRSCFASWTCGITPLDKRSRISASRFAHPRLYGVWMERAGLPV
jgi:hypothetical protein